MAQQKTKLPKKDNWVRSLLVTGFMVIAFRSFAVQGFYIPSGSMKNTLLVGDYIFVNELAYGVHSPKYIPFTDIAIPHFEINYNEVKRGDVVVFEYPGDRDLVVPKAKNVNYIKRCVAVAGDVVEVRNKQLYVNGQAFQNPNDLIFEHPALPKTVVDDRLFPKGNPGWNSDWYGPLRIPKRGDVIALDAKNIDSWSVFIQREGHSVETAASGAIMIDGAAQTSYTVKRDYLWMMGDNRDNSEDSRTWGFCPAENVVGNPMFIYWSCYNPPSRSAFNNNPMPEGYDPEEVQNFHIRWSRMFRGAN